LTEAEQTQVIEAVLDFCLGPGRGNFPAAARGRPPAARGPAPSKEARLHSYERAYLRDEGFESRLVSARQDLILELLERQRPRVVVEVGCGVDMLTRRALDAGLVPEQWVVVEPSAPFAALARDAMESMTGLSVVEGFFEDSVSELLHITGEPVDMVLLSGLLHELEDPTVVLDAAGQILSDGGLLHVNVPNAYSLHRRLAKAMQLISDVHQPSERNTALTQFHRFDRESLRAMLSDAGFVPEEEGGYFLKPFTHAQMLALEDLLSPEMLRGLWQLGRELPELASEIYVNARRRP
jgi:SAM-dependent methyltransferase